MTCPPRQYSQPDAWQAESKAYSTVSAAAVSNITKKQGNFRTIEDTQVNDSMGYPGADFERIASAHNV